MANEQLTLGYHKIRGLAAPLRMMLVYKATPFNNVAYGSDMKETWFGADKPELQQKNSCMNLPYIVDGDLVVTQSNTCAFYLGKRLAIDSDDLKASVHNHTVLDQAMDLRNDLMKIVYPFGAVKEKAAFPDAAKAHMQGSATNNFTKLEGFCEGPFMGGATPQSGDFMLFEMLDQHQSICAGIGEADILDKFPKLKAMHAAMKALPELAKYFASDAYLKYAQNNGLYAHFTGQPEDFVYDGTVRDVMA